MGREMKGKIALVVSATVIAFAAAGWMAQGRLKLGSQPDGSILVSTNQRLTPIGNFTRLEGQRPKDLALSPSGEFVAILAHRKLIISDAESKILAELPITAGPVGATWSADGKTVYASTSGGKILVAGWNGQQLAKVRDLTVNPSKGGDPHLAGLAVVGNKLFVAMTTRNAVAVVDLTTDAIDAMVTVGAAPFHLAVSPDGKTVAVSNRGGTLVAPSDAQMDPNTKRPFQGVGVPTADSAGTEVQIDPATDAAWKGSISFIDTETKVMREVAVGRQPSGLTFSASGKELYVAESDSDSVSFLNVPEGKVTGNLSIRPAEDPQFGQIPTDLAVSKDGKRLYVSCGGLNAVAIVDLTATPKVAGYVPTGWYPIAIKATGDHLFVASAKGVGSQPAAKKTGFGVHDSVGSFQSIPVSQLKNLKSHTKTVAQNNGWTETLAARKDRPAKPIPQRLGEPSVFKHVVYIIKENLTYDSALGDMKEGNGDPSLCLFGEKVTPNHHALSREFVLIDNFYTSGTNSADGHQWVASSIANGYTEQNYATNVRSYPYDGGDPLATSPEGFLWNAAAKAGKWVRVFGEFVDKPKIVNPATGKSPSWTQAWEDYKSGKNSMVIEAHTSQKALEPHLHPNYIGFPSIISDQWRADVFIKELNTWEKNGRMPALSMMLLPNDHTAGTGSTMPTPRATVADNDLALGRIVEAISQSPFWKETLILVVQDDSQLGVDHVDGHRSIAMCISPYTRRGAVVSDLYNHTSFIRTLELVLGIPPMNRFDRTGAPLNACFVDSPDYRPYTHKPNQIELNEMNPSPKQLTGVQRELALASEKLDLTDVDRGHAKTMAKAAWYSVHPNRPFPTQFYRPPADQD